MIWVVWRTIFEYDYSHDVPIAVLATEQDATKWIKDHSKDYLCLVAVQTEFGEALG